GSAGREPGSQFAKLRSVKQGLDWQFDGKLLANLGDHLRGQQRVSAELEEVVAGADAWHVQNLRPDLGQLLFDVRPWRDVPIVGCDDIRGWQRGAIDLAVR